MTTTDTATFRREIKFDRVTKDYACYLDGDFKGYAPTYSDGETLLDQIAYDLLSAGMHRTATELDGGSNADTVAEEVAATVVVPEQLPVGWVRMPEGDILDADGMRAQLPSSLCPDCQGAGWVPNGWGTGDQAGGWADTCACQDGASDDYGDALAEDAQGTYNGRTDIDPPVDDPTPLPPPWERPAARPLSDVAELAVEISAVDGLALAEARQLAADHLQRVTHAAGTVCTNCGNYGHSSADCPYAPLPLPKPRPRRPSPFPIIADALLAEADRVMAEVAYVAMLAEGERPAQPARRTASPVNQIIQAKNPTCGNCGGAHHIQSCPEIRAALFAQPVAVRRPRKLAVASAALLLLIFVMFSCDNTCTPRNDGSLSASACVSD